jgi:hypothetical protein
VEQAIDIIVIKKSIHPDSNIRSLHLIPEIGSLIYFFIYHQADSTQLRASSLFCIMRNAYFGVSTKPKQPYE